MIKKVSTLIVASFIAANTHYENCSSSKKEANGNYIEYSQRIEKECGACNGVGYFVCPKTISKRCPMCSGSGEKTMYQNGKSIKAKCDYLDCNGSGYITEPCPKCGGSGKRMCKACNGTGIL